MGREISPKIWLPVIGLTIIAVGLTIFFTWPKEEKIAQIETPEALEEEITLPEKETPLPKKETPQRESEVFPTIGEHPWPSYRHDNQNTGQSSYSGPENPILKWKSGGEGGIESSWLAISKDGTIYLHFNEEGVSAVNPDGTLKWNSGIVVTGGFAIASDGTVYVTEWSTESIGGAAYWWQQRKLLKLYFLDPEGEIKWEQIIDSFEVKTEQEWENIFWNLSSPVIDNQGNIYVVGRFYNHEERGVKDPGFLYAFSREGILKWKFPFSYPPFLTNLVPAIGKDGTIYLISWQETKLVEKEGIWWSSWGKGTLFALTSDGKTKWQYEIPEEEMRFAFPTLKPYPVLTVDENGNSYLLIENSRRPQEPYLYAINRDGELDWKISLPEMAQGGFNFLPPAISSDGTIYLAGFRWKEKQGQGIILALDRNGNFKWFFAIDKEIRSTLTIDGQGLIYFADENGELYALNPDGTLKWQYETHQPAEASLLEGAIAIGKEKTLYFAGTYSEGEDVIYAIGEER